MNTDRILSAANIRKLISEDFEDIVSSLCRLNAAKRDRVLTSIVQRIAIRSWRRSRIRRSALVRIIVGLLPESYALLDRLLHNQSDFHDYEIHFAFFCYLHWTARHKALRDCATDVLKLVRLYMVNARTDQAMAAWMASDMLGDHWETGPATRVLLDVAQNARRPFCRLAALDGIEKLLKRLDSHGSILVALSEIGKTDKSRKVREAAAAVIAKA